MLLTTTMRTFLRFLFGRFGRAAGVLLIVAAAWFYWRVWPERPLRTCSHLVHFTALPFWEVWSPHGDWTMYMSLDHDLRQEALRIDFAKGEWSVIPTPGRARRRLSVASPLDTSWMAWVDDKYQVHVMALPAGREMFTTPPIPSRAKSNPHLDVFASPDGAWLLAAPTGESQVGLWNVPAAKMHAILAVPGTAVATVAFAPENRLLIGRYDLEKTELRVTSYSLPDGQSEVELLRESAPDNDWHATLSPDGGRLFVTGGAQPRIWDMTTRPPAPIDWTWDHEPYMAQFSPDGRFVVTNEHNNHTWALRDARMGATIASENSGWLVPCERAFVHEHPWYVACDRRVHDFPKWMNKWMATQYERFADRITCNMVLIDTKTGRKQRSVPGDRFGGWSGDGSSFWTVTHPFDQQTRRTRITFNQWPLKLPGPPWWLCGLTVAGVGIIAYDYRRGKDPLTK